MTAYNIKLSNVKNAFNDIPSKGTCYKFHGDPNVPNMAESHAQGIAFWNDYLLVSHNNKGYSTGKMELIDRNSANEICTFDTPYDHYNHPGGMQLIGDYLAVSIENSSHDESKVCFYDLTKMTATAHPILDCVVEQNCGAGALGITNYTKDDTEYYLLATWNNGYCRFYVSNGKPLTDPDCAFTYQDRDQILDRDYQGFGLVTDTNQNIYMVAGRTEDLGSSNKDYLDLHQIKNNGTDWYFDKDVAPSRHMTCNHEGGAIDGMDGVHFRWTVGLVATNNDALTLWSSQRNFVADNYYTNGFK